MVDRWGTKAQPRMNAIRFYKNGILHRDDGPAVIWHDDTYLPDDPDEPYEIEEWWVNGSLIRCDFTYTQSWRTSYWLKDGFLHRDTGPAVSMSDGSEEWYRYGKRHRYDGPAINYPSGWCEWYLNGKLHREDGPAVIMADGREEWWINGEITKVVLFSNEID